MGVRTRMEYEIHNGGWEEEWADGTGIGNGRRTEDGMRKGGYDETWVWD